MTRRQEDAFMVFVNIGTWVSMFGASHTWEIVLAGAITLGCAGFIFRKR